MDYRKSGLCSLEKTECEANPTEDVGILRMDICVVLFCVGDQLFSFSFL